MLISAVCLLGAQTTRVADTPGTLFRLIIPQFNMTVEGDESASLPDHNVSHFEIRIQKSGINYGSIHSKINTEAADIIMKTTARGSEIVCSFDLELRSGFRFGSGRNSVEISFEDRRGKVFYSSFLLRESSPVNFRARKDVATVQLPAEKYAVIVGISKYANRSSQLPDLQFASRDANTFRDFLLSPEGGSFKSENIRYLINEEASAANIRTALFTFLTRPQKDDLVVVYFAGHGAPDPNDPRQLYLLAHDTDPANMGGTAVMMANFQDLFARILKPRKVVTFTDACHSQGIGGGVFGASAKQNNLINQYLARFAGEAERAIITASDISESSYESDQWGGGHGVFTYFLLEGLKGKADLNRDGTVVAGELFQYVQQQVRLATGGNQNPTVVAGLAEGLPLSGLGLRKSAYGFLKFDLENGMPEGLQ